jgi:hypothetical protein
MGKRKEDKMSKPKTPEQRIQEALDQIRKLAGMDNEK